MLRQYNLKQFATGMMARSFAQNFLKIIQGLPIHSHILARDLILEKLFKHFEAKKAKRFAVEHVWTPKHRKPKI